MTQPRLVIAACSDPGYRALATGAAEPEPEQPLRHHGDREAAPGLLDFAVNVYPERPTWLEDALHRAIADSGSYPDPEPARRAAADRHARPAAEVLVTAGAAEAFSLLARLPWRRPVVVHPQFTEPHAALGAAGHPVTEVRCRVGDGFALDPKAVPDDADLVVIGNPTNPTGVLHPAAMLLGLRRRGRLVVVDEAFMDAVPDEAESLAGERLDGVLVIRSLTKHWGIPGIRAGYVVGDAGAVQRLADLQPPWSVSTPAIAATVACCGPAAVAEATRRTADLTRWRTGLEHGLRDRGIEFVPSAAPFVLARLGEGVRTALRGHGIAVRRADTFPGLDGHWARIAARPPEATARLLAGLDAVRASIPR